MNPDLPKVRMLWVEEPIRFGWRKRGWNNQDRRPPLWSKAVPDGSEFRRRGHVPPVRRQLLLRRGNAGYAVRYFRRNQHEVLREIFGIKVHEVLNHCQRLPLGRVGQPCPGTRPTPSEAIRALSVQRLPGKRLSEDTINAGQLTPPYAMRPKTFSTLRAPGSVSRAWIGGMPPKARLGRFSQRIAVSSSPR